ncbi:hypothetical protein OUZ56_004286 [Daphnia magna]|uniref:Uncharacterized protein n=1 Tax=Daphnia magna TaxID=35525 RepID=A0ABQ9YPA6_9CRUS|nr:hypothetical protein OUZ56_004286 [Daphnia magna]
MPGSVRFETKREIKDGGKWFTAFLNEGYIMAGVFYETIYVLVPLVGGYAIKKNGLCQQNWRQSANWRQNVGEL